MLRRSRRRVSIVAYGRGVDGRLHDATRPGRKRPLSAATIERVRAMTLTD
jgi:hypothetical protein